MITIRRFTRKDAQSVGEFIIGVESEFIKKIDKFILKQYTSEHILDKWPGTYVLILEENKKIIGVGRAKPNGWITHMFIHKKHRNKGVGKRLMYRLESWLKRIPTKEIHLNSSPYAVKFYQHLGYQRVGRKKNYHGLVIYPMKKGLFK